MDLFASNNSMAGNEMGAMQMLLNQVKTLQEQVVALQSNNPAQLNVGKGSGTSMEVPVQPMPNVEMDLKAKMTAMLQGMNGNANVGGENACIWVAGIPEDFADTKIVCNIFGNYGNVMKVKFSRKKPDGALIELQDSTYASNCCKYLHNTRLGSARISVRPSKIQNVIIHPSEDNEKARDYSRGFAHRYRANNTKFNQIIMSRLSDPTPVLCISNIPEGKVSEVKDYLVEKGFEVREIQEGKKREAKEGESEQRKATFAFVEFASTEEAVSALGKLHNTMPSNIGEKNRGRGLTFSFTSKEDCNSR